MVRQLVFSLLLSVSIPAAAVADKPDAVLVFTAEMPEISAPEGDYAQLATLVQQTRLQHPQALFLFGGASLGPSMLSAFDNGSHIIDILNTLEPDVMAVASREFSYFEDELSLRAYEAGFPMLASNVYDRQTDDLLEGLVTSVVLQSGKLRFGVIAVMTTEVAGQYALRRAIITDPLPAIRQQAQLLRAEGVDVVVLLYSSELPELHKMLDQRVIDLSLRKDDHFLLAQLPAPPAHPRDIFLTRPGLAAVINISVDESRHLDTQTQIVKLRDYSQQPQVLRQINDYSNRLSALLNHTLGKTAVALDTRRQVIRTEETAFANFVADAVRQKLSADVALLNSGTMRGEHQYQAGSVITRRHIAREIPYNSHLALTTVSGKQLWQALENGVSQYHLIKGRFPAVSGLNVEFNTDLAVGQRVVSVNIAGKPLQPDKLYRLATVDYLLDGGDGYDALAHGARAAEPSGVRWLLSDVVIGVIQRQKVIAPVKDGRIKNTGTPINDRH